MFTLGINYKYWLYSKPTDMRKSFHALSGIVTSIMHKQLTKENVFVFINTRRNRIKLLHYEEGGLVIYSKLIENGKMKELTIEQQLALALEQIKKLQEEKMALEANKQKLEQFIEYLRAQLFGKKSKKLLPNNPNDLEPTLFDELLSTEEKEQLDKQFKKEQEELFKTITYTKKVKPNRELVLDTTNLRVEEEILTPDRPPFIISPLPESPIHKCMADTSVLTDIFIDKYVYHLPFYRVIQKYKELGVKLNDSTIYDWFAATCTRLKPIYDCLYEHILSQKYIQIDESTLPVVDDEKHRAVKGYIWVIRSVSDGASYFYYKDGSRSYNTALSLLYRYNGTIQCDGYEVYNKLENKRGFTVLGCWAHTRRYFFRAKNSSPKLAETGMDYISKLYAIESQADNLCLTPNERKNLRQEKSYPIIKEFEEWIKTNLLIVRKGTPIEKALSYAYTYLPRLSRYVLNGTYLPDNNLIENAIRPLAVGRKGYLFCDNHISATRAALAYSLISSYKAAGVEPREWLSDVLNKSYHYEINKKDFTELLPHNWKTE